MKEKLKLFFADYGLFRCPYSKDRDDENRRYKIMLHTTTTVAVVSAMMCLLNIITGKSGLMMATFFFAVFNAVFALVLKLKNGIGVHSYIIFIAGVMVLFGNFLITGGTEGFSPIWIIILPTAAYMAVGLKMGMFYSLMVLLEIIFFLYIPAGKQLLQYSYSDSFTMRFPLVYFASCAIGFFIEANREFIYGYTNILKNRYAYAMNFDVLTGLHNRTWFNSYVEKIESSAVTGQKIGVLIIDIDSFKSINDTYGHLVGDEVLKQTAMVLRKNSPSDVTRWGGEEFITITDGLSKEELSEYAEKIRLAVSELNVNGVSGQLTVSIGLHVVEWEKSGSVTELIRVADMNLNEAKRNGKNRVFSN